MSEQTTLANKKRRLEKHLSKFPNDQKAAQVAKTFSPKPRKAPLTKKWSKDDKRMAEMVKSLGYKGNSVLSEGGLVPDKKKVGIFGKRIFLGAEVVASKPEATINPDTPPQEEVKKPKNTRQKRSKK